MKCDVNKVKPGSTLEPINLIFSLKIILNLNVIICKLARDSLEVRTHSLQGMTSSDSVTASKAY